MDDKLVRTQKLNKELNIKSVFDESFTPYGKPISLKTQKALINFLDKDTLIPEKGNIYIPSVEEWEKENIVEELSPYFKKEVQIGYCNGQNTHLNALEWHNCDEINVYATDAVLFLATIEDLDENFILDESKIKSFFVPKNTSILLYNTTLHYSPCKVNPSGFKAIIVLEKDTNTDIDKESKQLLEKSEDRYKSLILKKNKYIICHKDATTLTLQNVKVGIKGQNLKVNI